MLYIKFKDSTDPKEIFKVEENSNLTPKQETFHSFMDDGTHQTIYECIV